MKLRCPNCGRPPRDNFERVELEQGGVCLRATCTKPRVPENYPTALLEEVRSVR